MKRRRLLGALAGAASSGGISMTPAATRSEDAMAGGAVRASAPDLPIEAMRAATGPAFDALWRDARHELQLIYTRIDRVPPGAGAAAASFSLSGSPARLTHFRFGVAPQRWFAAASLVKLPVAALALERVAELAAQGVTRDTPFALRTPLRCMQIAAAEQESVARAIRRMFVVSENEPFNRLYELLGQNRMHQRFAALGLAHSRVINRIAPCAPADNRVTGAVEFLDEAQRVLARIDGETAREVRRFPHGRALKGSAWAEAGKTIPGPRDFSERNFVPLDEAHQMLIALVLPEAVPAVQRFRLDDGAHVFLRHCMGMLPSECADPVYAARDYSETYAKYLIGGAGLAPLPPGVRSFNKVGRSFGYLSDCAYINDAARGVEFFLSVSVYVNEDDVLNDGKYEYKETGWPFLAALGRAALEVDAARRRGHPALRIGADGRFAA